jgi:hypothetical protein
VVFDYPNQLVAETLLARLAEMDLNFVDCVPDFLGDYGIGGACRAVVAVCGGLVLHWHTPFCLLGFSNFGNKKTAYVVW